MVWEHAETTHTYLQDGHSKGACLSRPSLGKAYYVFACKVNRYTSML